MTKVEIERVWGSATASGGGHVLRTHRGVIHMIACDLPAASVRITMHSAAGSTAQLHLTLAEAAELINDLKAVAFDG